MTLLGLLRKVPILTLYLAQADSILAATKPISRSKASLALEQWVSLPISPVIPPMERITRTLRAITSRSGKALVLLMMPTRRMRRSPTVRTRHTVRATQSSFRDGISNVGT